MIDDRGVAVSVWVTLALPAFIVAVGLGVDLSGHAAAEQQARATAAEAARTATHRVMLSSSGASLPVGPARSAALGYASAAGFDADVQVQGMTAEVTVRGDYETLFLPLIGVDRLNVVGVGTATVAEA